MILLTHLLVGAVIGSKIGYFWIAIVLALLSHYLLDSLPHIEYPIENIQNNQWQKTFPEFLTVALDLFLGLLIIFLLSSNSFKIYICAFIALIPDGLTFLIFFLKNNVLLKKHSDFHRGKIHFFKNKKISTFWRFLTQIIITLLSIFLLLL
jgi:uncharacterized protein YacL